MDEGAIRGASVITEIILNVVSDSDIDLCTRQRGIELVKVPFRTARARNPPIKPFPSLA